MLEKLINEIRQGGTLDIAKLALKLETSPQMVAAMLEHLQRTGILLPYKACSEPCSGCGLSQECKPLEKSKAIPLFYLS